ncbi:AcrR family transcriptional regulator [Kibdelosporangium banguiense]|uniref:AcrR family transcriptional regulator n=1 Tax=Kibdelosporangium banguiense TaxID=1365924 RepID=A0ABS4TPX7_9PSEU|nr:TetR/AcrR family transcriptional regulator [Kibdelosporangium banguiense]MBP2326461.1 AcrR family transcriptional regulator [Kibdelosporangium banguiense]
MPKYVDPEQRSREIVEAAVAALSEGGFAKFTLRNLAQRMGGSMSLITHYFPNREALIEGILTAFEQDIAEFNEEMQSVGDPAERLHRVVEWALPLAEDGLIMERARIALLAHRDAEPAIDAFFVRLEPLMRGVYRDHVAALVDEADLEFAVDLMRAWVNGLTLSAIEHPEIWTRERQLRVVDAFFATLPLREPVTLVR